MAETIKLSYECLYVCLCGCADAGLTVIVSNCCFDGCNLVFTVRLDSSVAILITTAIQLTVLNKLTVTEIFNASCFNIIAPIVCITCRVLLSIIIVYLECFYTVGWVTGRECGL